MMDTRLRLDYPSEGRTLRRSYVTLTVLLQETIISYFHTKVPSSKSCVQVCLPKSKKLAQFQRDRATPRRRTACARPLTQETLYLPHSCESPKHQRSVH